MDNGIVISSRVRLARNFAGYPFPAHLDSEKSLALTQKVYEALGKGEEKFSIVRISDMGKQQGEALKELHLISDDLLRINKYSAVIVNKSNDVSVMVNEEDHVRAQCILPGNLLAEAYEKISDVDDMISAGNNIAYSPSLGYLTACPTNVGTGMRASAMMFLPGLSLTKSLEKCIGAVARFDMTVRGEYGEGTSSEGYLYQVSNAKTLGLTEKDIVSGVSVAVEQLEKNEITARQLLLEQKGTTLRDGIMRAYGVLTNAYTLTTKEFMDKLGLVKLGVWYGFLNCDDVSKLDELAKDCRPANMTLKSGKNMDSEERDVYRAEKVAETLSTLVRKTKN
ncbi:MAG: ATP--guanido phosphotransferase [Clostridia bacterium]|nr:ATP--guanido phosphotransferase [Clostridia bacterium]